MLPWVWCLFGGGIGILQAAASAAPANECALQGQCGTETASVLGEAPEAPNAPEVGEMGDDTSSAIQVRNTARLGAEAGSFDGRGGGGEEPGYYHICSKFRDALWPSVRVLCGQDILSDGFDVYNIRCALLMPRFVVQPTTARDVQITVRMARKFGLPISFRGSGHTYNCNGFRSGSVNLDMRSMGNAVTLKTRAKGASFATLAPGARFLDMLNRSNIPANLAFTHGTCPTVGVMGYHLQGGWGATTSTWANESIVWMQVVTANGTLLELDSSSTGAEADLWRAMRVAGSSFGIVTSLTIKLFNSPQRPYMLLPVKNSFKELLAVVPDEAPFGWVGLARWDSVFFDQGNKMGSGWIVQVVLNDDTVTTKAQLGAWVQASALQVLPNFSEPIYQPVSSDTWFEGRYPFPDSGMFSRSYPLSEIRGVARVLNKFLEKHADSCRYNLGPLKGDKQLPIATLECNTVESLKELENFVKKNSDTLKPNRPGSGYVNLPLDGSKRYRAAYWPQYDELSAIKRVWDPEDFFYLENGIHP